MQNDSFCRLKPPYEQQTALWKITSACNLRCAHCFTSRFDSEPVAWDSMLDQLRQLQISRVVLTGGEPLLHPELACLVSRLQANGISSTLLTNGLALTPRCAHRLAQAGLNTVSISLHSPQPETQNQISGGKTNFTRLVRAFHACQETNLPFTISSVALPANVGQIGQLIDFAFGLGATSLSLNSFLPFPGVSDAWLEWQKFSDSDAILEIISRKRVQYGDDFIKTAGFVTHSADQTCPAGTFFHGITTSGRWTPCLTVAETRPKATWQGCTHSYDAYQNFLQQTPPAPVNTCPLLSV